MDAVCTGGTPLPNCSAASCRLFLQAGCQESLVCCRVLLRLDVLGVPKLYEQEGLVLLSNLLFAGKLCWAPLCLECSRANSQTNKRGQTVTLPVSAV
eukprot:11089-Pelagomonas_calceolata.AAC.13